MFSKQKPYMTEAEFAERVALFTDRAELGLDLDNLSDIFFDSYNYHYSTRMYTVVLDGKVNFMDDWGEFLIKDPRKWISAEAFGEEDWVEIEIDGKRCYVDGAGEVRETRPEEPEGSCM